MSRFGATWWGKRWLRTLEQLGLTYPDSRMSRARSLVTKEAVDLLHVETGELSAWVDQPRKSFGVSVTIAPFSQDRWHVFDSTVAARLSNLAELLDDRLPADIDRQLEPAGLTLFPADSEIDSSCPCRDRTRVCVHVIAIQHAFAVLFDDDPYLLPLLRGRDRAELLAAVRAAGPARTGLPEVTEGEAVPLSAITTDDFYLARGNIDTIVR